MRSAPLSFPPFHFPTPFLGLLLILWLTGEFPSYKAGSNGGSSNLLWFRAKKRLWLKGMWDQTQKQASSNEQLKNTRNEHTEYTQLSCATQGKSQRRTPDALQGHGSHKETRISYCRPANKLGLETVFHVIMSSCQPAAPKTVVHLCLTTSCLLSFLLDLLQIIKVSHPVTITFLRKSFVFSRVALEICTKAPCCSPLSLSLKIIFDLKDTKIWSEDREPSPSPQPVLPYISGYPTSVYVSSSPTSNYSWQHG